MLRRTPPGLDWQARTITYGDGDRSVRYAIAAYDAEHPLPPPPPRCGQVWVWPGGVAEQVLQVDPDGTAHTLAGEYRAAPNKAQVRWPPPGAVLVSGPSAPWAPMGAADAVRPIVCPACNGSGAAGG